MLIECTDMCILLRIGETMIGNKVLSNVKLLLVSIFFAVCFLCFYSKSTTPLMSGYWGWDSAFFILVGQGMTKGMLPYRDFFDMKGPYLFFLQYIGQLICYGRMGAFIIQTVNLTFCLFLMGKISDLFAKTHIWLHRLGMFLLALIFFAATITDGNLTEEYCITPILLSLYFCLKYFKTAEEKNEYKHPLVYSLINGFSVGYISFIRITNAAGIGAVLLTVFLFLLVKKEIKNALLNLGVLMGGFAIASAIPCIIFYSKHMLREMIYQVFIFGFTYSTEVGFTEKLFDLFIKYKFLMLISSLPLFICFVYREKWYYRLLSISSVLMVLFAITLGNMYRHYFTLIIPSLILGTAIAYKDSRNVKKQRRDQICVLCFVVLIALNITRIVRSSAHFLYPLSYFSLEMSDGGKPNKVTEMLLSNHLFADRVIKPDWNKAALEIASYIPDNEKESVYCFGDSEWSRWYGATGTLPANKNMDWQAHYIELIPDLKYEISGWIEEEGSLWIVTSKVNEYSVEEIDEAIENNYEKVFENSDYTLFHRTAV